MISPNRTSPAVQIFRSMNGTCHQLRQDKTITYFSEASRGVRASRLPLSTLLPYFGSVPALRHPRQDRRLTLDPV